MKKQTQNGYNNTTPDPIFHSFKEMEDFMQGVLRPSLQPKEIEHVVLDADDTMWQIEPWGVASVVSPIGHTDKDELPVELRRQELAYTPQLWEEVLPTGRVTLDPTLRDTLDKLKDKAISVSIASINTKPSIMRFLKAFGLEDKFVDVEANIGDSKGKMVRRIAERQNIDPGKILFVNDSFLNGLDVARETGATPLIMGYNIDSIADIMEFIQ